MGSRVGAVVRALASHQCVPRSIPGPSVICWLSGFSSLLRGTPVFLPPQKSTFLNSNSIGSLKATGLSETLPCITLVKQLEVVHRFNIYLCPCYDLKARLHRRFLSRQLNAIFVAPKLHQVSNMFETHAISRRQIALKIAPGLHVRF